LRAEQLAHFGFFNVLPNRAPSTGKPSSAWAQSDRPRGDALEHPRLTILEDRFPFFVNSLMQQLVHFESLGKGQIAEDIQRAKHLHGLPVFARCEQIHSD
jgi:hypothetical protein